ncbi:MAG: alpha/beta hydrolase [Hyphomicrobiales bacterium]
MQAYILLAVQKLFAGTSLLSPGTAARMAHFLLTHPAMLAMRTHAERTLLQRAEPLKQSAEKLNVVTPGGTMQVYYWPPASETGANAPVAILAHGWGGQGLFMAQFVEPLRQAGFQVAAVDLPGHGGSASTHTDPANAAELVIATARALGRADILIGHSFGALAVLHAAAGGAPLHDNVAAKKLALISAPASIEGVFRRIARLLDLSAPAEEKLISLAGERLGAELNVLDANLLLERCTGKVLAIHDEDDFEIPLETSVANVASGKNIKALITTGLGHREILMDDAVIDAVAKFAAKK